jgi:hypothetical protein
LPSEQIELIVSTTYDDVKAGDRTITVSYTLSGNYKDNYLAPVTETLPGKITPKPLLLSSVFFSCVKVYDGNATVNGTIDVAFEGIVGSEPVSVDATASFDNKNVGIRKNITVSFSLAGDAAVTANYSAPENRTVNEVGTITARPLKITSLPTVTTTKMYDGSTMAAVTDNATTDALAGDQLIVTPTANYADKNWGDAKPITINYTLSGADAGNYSALASSEVTGSISRRQLTIQSQHLVTEKGYDGTTTAQLDSVVLSGVAPGDLVGLSPLTAANYDNASLGTGKTITVVYNIVGETENYLKPVDFKTTNGVIKKDILVTSYNSANTSWSPLTTVSMPMMTSLPTGYTIFDRDNAGNFYAGHSDGSIKKFIDDSWSTTNIFSGVLPLPTGSFKFAGIYIVDSDQTAIAVDSSNNAYLNTLPPGNLWGPLYGVINPNSYQLVGSYYDVSSFYLVYQNGSDLYKYDLNYGTTMEPLPGSVTIPDGYSICGFNYTSQLNMYLTR